MRPIGRWWVFVPVMALAWGGYWWLDRRALKPVPVSSGPGTPSPIDRGPYPGEPGAIGEAPGPLPTGEALPGVGDGPPRPDADDEAAGPVAGNPSEFEGLPAIDDQIRQAAGVASDRASAGDIARADRARGEGRFADAERILLSAIRKPAAIEARKRLVELYWLEGRLDEVCRMAEATWREAGRIGAREDARAMLQIHLATGLFRVAPGLYPLPVDRIAMELDRAIGLAPRDDRVWLGRGYLALRRGRLAEAASWLDACRRERPDDPAVWRARLEWAVAADRVAEAREAMGRLPAVEEPPARIHELRAWLAARRGDADAERQALRRAVAADPAAVAALERLAELAARGGRTDVAARFRRQKARLDESLHRYRALFRAGDLDRDAAGMARLAESLGRRFEALALWTIAAEPHSEDPDAAAALRRLAHPEAESPKSGRTLADLLADDLGSAADEAMPDRRPAGRRSVPQFRDDAKTAGLAFAFDNGATPQRQLPETMSGGVGLLDYDGDGRLDVYLVQGGTFPPAEAARTCGDRLYRNRGDGTFEDATRASGLSTLRGGYGHGVTVGDYDNDGHPDLFVTRWRRYALYRNRGDGTFEDATDRAGLGGDRDWPTSSAFADLDGDGDLDLYVAHYLAWDADRPEVCRSPATRRVIACEPLRFAARPDHLFRNDGGRFVDVTKESGIEDADGRGLGVLAADLDEDDRIDLFVANDGTANLLFLNRGNMKFEEAGHAAGVAAAGGGGYRAGMGVALGDLDGDGRPDLTVTNFLGESSTFYQNLGDGQFTDRTSAIGLAALSRYRLGFGIAFLDADDDGRPDLLTVNGHLSDEGGGTPYAMPTQLLLTGSGGRLVDIGAAAGTPFLVPRVGRGLAVGDLDDDGRLDAIISDNRGPAAYFHNRGPGGHSITFRLQGTTSNRDAVGARVAIEAVGGRQVAHRFGGGSYQSSGDPRLHFGLGTSARVDRVEVHWPSGRVDRFRDLPADSVYLLREGEPMPRRSSKHPEAGAASSGRP